MTYLLFFIYLLLLCWLVTKIPFIKKAGIAPGILVILFLVKVTAGLALGFFTSDIVNDYWPLNADSMNEHRLLLADPWSYFTNIFHSGYAKGYGGFLDALPSYWNDLRITLISKALAWFNFLSNGNYYINSLLFNFFSFMGHVAFYRVFIQVYPARKKIVMVCCFLLPSMLYFSSGVQKDGIVFTALGFLCYSVFQSVQKNSFSAMRILGIFFTLTILFFVRSYVVMLILPALFLWILVVKRKWPVFRTFAAGYLIMGILFFGLHFISGGFNPLEAVTKKQEAFFMLEKASTQVPLDTLKPTFTSFVKNAPQAFSHSFLRPGIYELQPVSILPAVIETFIFHLLALVFLFSRKKMRLSTEQRAFITAGVFFAVSIYLFIGYIVPNMGSIVRYRSIYILFLITPLASGIDCGKFFKSVKFKK
ncbi:MAG: hypothetical protein U0V75_12780 [Ferruginibacter sp.]